MVISIVLTCLDFTNAQVPDFISVQGKEIIYRFDPAIKEKPLRIPSPFTNLATPDNRKLARSSEDCSLSADIRVTYAGFNAQAQMAFQHAVDIWKRCIVATTPIRIGVDFTNLGANTLGQAIVARYIIDQSGNDLPMKNVPYPVALANNIVGYDIYPSEPDIIAEFNSGVSWYFGTDGKTPANQIDFVTVVLHEICHGLGFAASAQSDNTVSNTFIGRDYTIDNESELLPTIFDRKLEEAGGTKITTLPNFSNQLLSALTSELVFFDDMHARAANGGKRVPLYAPTIFDQGSSISHLAESFNGTVNALMTYSLAAEESIHDPGPVNIGILEDVGWPINQNCFPTYLYVNKNFVGVETGAILNPFKSLEKAHEQSTNGSTIFFLSSGVHDETNDQLLDRKVLLRLANGGSSVIIR
ncbi:MAG: hypothetical protein HKN87_10310 [Saprospiraceae bacterium]|nr:hypothetical protein [Saprospiraceae bacterium]